MLRRCTVALTFAAVIVASTSPASAHQPIVLGEGDTTPADGPRIPDGTVSFAVYGSLTAPGDTRGFRVGFAAGDEIVVGLLIPDQSPERDLPGEALPRLMMTAPDGTETVRQPVRGEPFLEPFSGTRYIELGEWRTVAVDGTYGFTVTGSTAARFTVSVGTREIFGTPVEDVDGPTGLGDVAAWYENPPGAETPLVDGEPVAATEDSSGVAPLVVALAGGGAAALLVAGWALTRRRRS